MVLAMNHFASFSRFVVDRIGQPIADYALSRFTVSCFTLARWAVTTATLFVVAEAYVTAPAVSAPGFTAHLLLSVFAAAMFGFCGFAHRKGEKAHWEATESFRLPFYTSDMGMALITCGYLGVTAITLAALAGNGSWLIVVYAVLTALSITFSLCRADVPPPRRETAPAPARA